MKLKAVIFDLDHTLFDRHGTLREVAKQFRHAFRVKEGVTDEEIARLWCYADDHFVYDGWKYVLDYLTENGIFEQAPPFDAYRSFVYENFAKTAVRFDEAVPMLLTLKKRGYAVGLITNGNHALQYRKLDMIGLRKLFDEIIVSGDVLVEKPDREIFLMMCDKLSLRPEQMIYVGDNPRNDIAGARDAGYHTIWMKSTGMWDYELAPAEESVDRVEEIPAAVERIASAVQND
ncbi:MAG: HAD family hydrolase [Clostridia bacterium]|nr:HAD family hydrolase [Clostridia bacterium]